MDKISPRAELGDRRNSPETRVASRLALQLQESASWPGQGASSVLAPPHVHSAHWPTPWVHLSSTIFGSDKG